MSEDIDPSDAPSAQHLALNAALDGTATADERALIDASPELTQALADLELARRTMPDVDVPADARESGIRAALAVFDTLHDVAAPSVAAAAAPSNVVKFERRRQWYRADSGAAAAILLVVGAVALARSTGGEDNDESATFDASSQKTAEDDGGAAPAAADPPAEVAPMADNAGDTLEPDTADRAGSQVETAAASETTATATAEAPAPAATVTPSTIGSIDAPAEATPEIADEEALRQYAASAPADADAAPADDCAPGTATRLGAIRYQGTPAIVVRDDAGKVLAYATDDCTLLATIPA